MSKKYLDLEGTKYLLEEIKEIIESEAVDLTDYVTRTELQQKLDALEIDIDLDDYATKEYVINAINNAQLGGGDGSGVDLSIYALKSDLDGKADTNHTHSEYLTQHQDISGKLDKTAASSTYLSKSDASSTYLTKTDASSTYLGKSANAASATKATQDGSGNTITSTYATKTELSNAIASAITTALNTAV